MPQLPARRHVLATVRILAGLSQKQLAKLLDCSAITIQKIEQGHLKLSEDLARRAEREIDVSAGWLLANDPKLEPITPRGGAWSRDLFEFAQGGRFFALEKRQPGRSLFRVNFDIAPEESADEFTAWRAAEYSALIHAMLAKAKASPRQGILLNRLKTFTDSLAEDFPADETTLKAYAGKIDRLKTAFKRKAKQIGQAEEERLWADREPRGSKS
jgi:transcriptional regulator with XRE-family HTH domain